MRKTISETPSRVTTEATTRCTRYWWKRVMAPFARVSRPAYWAGLA
jgi:hypothetical protein